MPLVVLPQMILGGILVPRDAMGAVARAVSDWLPLSDAVDAVDAVAVGGSAAAGWRPLGVVADCAVLAVALGAMTLRRRTP